MSGLLPNNKYYIIYITLYANTFKISFKLQILSIVTGKLYLYGLLETK